MPIDPNIEIHAHLIAELRTDLSTTTARLDAALTRIDDLEQGHAELEACQSDADEEIAALRVRIDDLGAEITNLRARLDRAEHKLTRAGATTPNGILTCCATPSTAVPITTITIAAITTAIICIAVIAL